jgi:hypothetical protein
MVAHLTAMQYVVPGFESGSSPAHGTFCHPPWMTQYRVFRRGTEINTQKS